MSKRLKIAVLRDRYSTRFNTPQVSRHVIKPVWFLPADKIARRIGGLTLTLPTRANLAHFVNRIPAFSGRPFVMSFESHLPEYFGGQDTAAVPRFMRRRLAGRKCRRILAMSQFAKINFYKQHAGTPEYGRLVNKLEVIYPSMVLPDCRLEPRKMPLPLRLVFAGTHFGSKGGAVAIRAAEIARVNKMPLHFHIISSLKAGRGAWGDPWQDDFFAPYMRHLSADNITFDPVLSDAKVLQILRESDFSILAAFHETFPYRAVESMSVGTPVIATPQGAFPEFITSGQNGLMLSLDVDETGEWTQINRTDKASNAYADMFREEIERLARELIDAVTLHCESPEKLHFLRANARSTAETMFDSVQTSAYLDDLYERCAIA